LLNNKHYCSKPTQKISIIALSVISVVATFIITLSLCIGGTDAEDESISSMGGVDGPGRTYRTVQLLEKKTDNAESAYEVGTYLNGSPLK
jgi:hypothetical protein